MLFQQFCQLDFVLSNFSYNELGKVVRYRRCDVSKMLSIIYKDVVYQCCCFFSNSSRKRNLWSKVVIKELLQEFICTSVFFVVDIFLCLFLIPDFGVSTAILNMTDISRRWCKLNFGTLRGYLKSCHFLERIDARRQYFYFFIQSSWNNWQEITQTTLLYTNLGLLLPFKWNQIRLKLGQLLLDTKIRSSHRRCSIIKGVLRNFAKFKGKHLCRTPFLQNTSEGLLL